MKIHSLNPLGEIYFEGVQKPSQKDHFLNKCGMHWNASLKQLNESLKSWFGS